MRAVRPANPKSITISDDYVPLVAAYKSLDTRHLTHLSERWTTDRTDGLHHFFFNGIGYESWESIWSAQKLSASSSGSVREHYF
eukprot:COSAG04_NODE_2286_length_4387_cov_1.480392_5_plen_84_part_00